MWIYTILAIARITMAGHECEDDASCEKRWPGATCHSGRCTCSQDTIRRKSDSNGWVCLSLMDASTGMLGPPFTCPLPDGAGYRSVLYRDGEPVFCRTGKKGNCPDEYECIQSVGQTNSQGNGVCCPRRETACQQAVSESTDGWLVRWYFNGKKCEPFHWNPELKATANNFVTKAHCQTYCSY